jgi:hypothetical protein
LLPQVERTERLAPTGNRAKEKGPSVVHESRILLPISEPIAGKANSQGGTRKGNTVHIGSVDIQITPPAAPVKSPPPQVRQRSVSVLSRGFTSSFGLRQA